MGDGAAEDWFEVPRSSEGLGAGLILGPAGMVLGNKIEGEKRDKARAQAEADEAAREKARADAQAAADAKAKADAEAAATEEARRVAELRLARRTRAMSTDSDTVDSARLRLG